MDNEAIAVSLILASDLPNDALRIAPNASVGAVLSNVFQAPFGTVPGLCLLCLGIRVDSLGRISWLIYT